MTYLLRSVPYLFIFVTESLFCRVAGRFCVYCLFCFSFSMERLGAGLQWCRTLTAQRKAVAACPELKSCTLFPYKYTLNCIRFSIRMLFLLFIYLKTTANVRSILHSNPKLLWRSQNKKKPCKAQHCPHTHTHTK